MSYAKAMDYILSFSDYERNPGEALAPIHYNLNRVRRLLEVLGHPEQRFQSIHIAGTKGKGSTAAMIAAVLAHAGFRTGFFSSPHLHTYRERIRVNGALISEEDLCRAVDLAKPAVDALRCDQHELGSPTTFEITTAIAFQHFAASGVGLAVLEVGLGGRLDATNVVEPLVAVITPISLDHTRVLGSTVGEIAREKAGIIKPQGIVVVAPQPAEALEVIRGVAAEKQARVLIVGEDYKWWPCQESGGTIRQAGALGALSFSGAHHLYERVPVPLMGEHQLVNAATAMAAIEALRLRGLEIDPAHVVAGIGGVRWPGRMELLSERPTILVDGAHNADSMRKLAQALRTTFPGRRIILVIGTSLDKDLAGIAREIVPEAACTIVTKSEHPRSAPPGVIARQASPYTARVLAVPSVRAALATAREIALPEDVICVTGSLFVVAEAREALGFGAA